MPNMGPTWGPIRAFQRAGEAYQCWEGGPFGRLGPSGSALVFLFGVAQLDWASLLSVLVTKERFIPCLSLSEQHAPRVQISLFFPYFFLMFGKF